jgi:hypothetical protein
MVSFFVCLFVAHISFLKYGALLNPFFSLHNPAHVNLAPNDAERNARLEAARLAVDARKNAILVGYQLETERINKEKVTVFCCVLLFLCLILITTHRPVLLFFTKHL